MYSQDEVICFGGICIVMNSFKNAMFNVTAPELTLALAKFMISTLRKTACRAIPCCLSPL